MKKILLGIILGIILLNIIFQFMLFTISCAMMAPVSHILFAYFLTCVSAGSYVIVRDILIKNRVES